MTMLDIVPVYPIRIAIGAYNGSLKSTPAALDVIVIRETCTSLASTGSS